MVEVDPAFADPTTFIGPVHGMPEAERLAAEKGWAIKRDGDKWRRVVASPEPRRIFELRASQWLLQQHTVVITAGLHASGELSKLARIMAGEAGTTVAPNTDGIIFG